MDIKEKQYFSSLYAIYKPVLSPKMISYLDDFLLNDLGVSEISENANVSRQAISTQIKRGINELEDYETKLKIFSSFNQRMEIEYKIKETKDLNLINELIKIEEND